MTIGMFLMPFVFVFGYAPRCLILSCPVHIADTVSSSAISLRLGSSALEYDCYVIHIVKELL